MAYQPLVGDELRTALAICLYYQASGGGPTVTLPDRTPSGNEPSNTTLKLLATRHNWIDRKPEEGEVDVSPILFGVPKAPNTRVLYRLVERHFDKRADVRAAELNEAKEDAREWMESHVERSKWSSVGEALGLGAGGASLVGTGASGVGGRGVARGGVTSATAFTTATRPAPSRPESTKPAKRRRVIPESDSSDSDDGSDEVEARSVAETSKDDASPDEDEEEEEDESMDDDEEEHVRLRSLNFARRGG